MGGTQHGFCPDLLMAPTGWPRLTVWCVYIISQCPCIPIVNQCDLLLSVNPHELFTSTHYLFSDNHFVYTAGTSCPRNPWFMTRSKVNMQHLLSPVVYEYEYPTWGLSCKFVCPLLWTHLNSSYSLYVCHTQKQAHSEFLLDFYSWYAKTGLCSKYSKTTQPYQPMHWNLYSSVNYLGTQHFLCTIFWTTYFNSYLASLSTIFWWQFS